MTDSLNTEESTFKVERDHLENNTPCVCPNCGWRGTYEELSPITGCSLTPGDASPAGRCPECDALAYPDQPNDRARNNAVELLRLVREFLGNKHTDNDSSGHCRHCGGDLPKGRAAKCTVSDCPGHQARARLRKIDARTTRHGMA